jgi:hypothetical protein
MQKSVVGRRHLRDASQGERSGECHSQIHRLEHGIDVQGGEAINKAAAVFIGYFVNEDEQSPLVGWLVLKEIMAECGLHSEFKNCKLRIFLKFLECRLEHVPNNVLFCIGHFKCRKFTLLT